MANNLGSTENYHIEKNRRSANKLLSLLKEHHDFDVPTTGFVPRSRVIEIQVADDEQVELLEVCMLPIPAPKITVDGIKRIVCRHFNITHNEMVSSRRDLKALTPRNIAIFLSREFTPFSLPTIARYFGSRDHTTVLHATRKVGAMLEANHPIMHDVQCLREVLSA